LQTVYRKLGFTEFSMKLSTRPERFVGDVELWDSAEATLQAALNESCGPGKWSINAGDGAFYGPKVDVLVCDAMQRMHQCGTVQLDFQLPRRFKLSYTSAEQTLKVPVMIHRAILGSVERMFAILTEHCGGRWPLWLNPRAVACIPVAGAHHVYAKEVVDRLKRTGIRAFLFADGATLPKKVRTAQVQQYSYILVVGDAEASTQTVSVRSREVQGQVQSHALDAFITMVVDEMNAPFR
jgi:threonyl-tRNA synthetase